MNIENRLKELILYRYGNFVAFSKVINIPYSTLVTILKRGIRNAGIDNIISICNALEISVDELANGRISPATEYIQRKSHITDLDAIIDYTKRNLQEYSDLTLDGQPLTQGEIENLIDAVDVAVEIIKRNRKRANNE